MDAKSVLTANYEANNGSFIYYLHERDEFVKTKFEELVRSINVLFTEGDFSRETGDMVRVAQLETAMHLLYHFNPEDSCVLKCVPEDLYDGYLQKINAAAEKYFSGYLKVKE